MADPSAPRARLFIDAPLMNGAPITLSPPQSHYLLDVLRFKEGDMVSVFNGRDGEWQAGVVSIRKKIITVTVGQNTAPQKNTPDLWLLCAPLKSGRTDWVVEKATELGVSRICPVSTRYTVIDRVNEERLKSIAIEAAEQCGRMDIP